MTFPPPSVSILSKSNGAGMKPAPQMSRFSYAAGDYWTTGLLAPWMSFR